MEGMHSEIPDMMQGAIGTAKEVIQAMSEIPGQAKKYCTNCYMKYEHQKQWASPEIVDIQLEGPR